MKRRAAARGTITQLAGVGLRIGDEFAHRPHRQRRAHHQHVRNFRHQRNRREIPDRIIGQLLIKRREYRGVGDRPEQECVAVRRRLGGGVRRDEAARAGSIVDDDVLAKCVAQRRRHDTRHEICRSTRREADQQTDGAMRISGASRAIRIKLGSRGGQRLRQRERNYELEICSRVMLFHRLASRYGRRPYPERMQVRAANKRDTRTGQRWRLNQSPPKVWP